MMSAKLLELLLTAASVGIGVDALLAEYLKRKDEGQTEQELRAWARDLLQSKITAAQAAIDRMPG